MCIIRELHDYRDPTAVTATDKKKQKDRCVVPWCNYCRVNCNNTHLQYEVTEKIKKQNERINVSSQKEPLLPGSWMSGFLAGSAGV